MVVKIMFVASRY